MKSVKHNIYSSPWLWLLAGCFIGVVIAFLIIEIRNRCFISNDTHALLGNIITKLIRQSARWSAAAQQDKNPVINMMHANYGSSYLFALKGIIGDTNLIENVSGVDLMEFEKKITDVQDGAMAALAKICPDIVPKEQYLAKIAGEI